MIDALKLVHFERDDMGATRRQERRADRIARMRLVRSSALASVETLTVDPARMALDLDVTERIMRVSVREHRRG